VEQSTGRPVVVERCGPDDAAGTGHERFDFTLGLIVDNLG
jgi:hypothetical protein